MKVIGKKINNMDKVYYMLQIVSQLKEYGVKDS